MRHRGFEPRTTWLKVKCSTNWANIPFAFQILIWKCPVPESNQRHEDFQSSALPTELTGHELRGQDLNLRPSGYEPDELPDCSTPRYNIKFWLGGEGFEPSKQFAADLQSVPFGHSGIHQYLFFKPMIGLEPITCWLQISCSANWATSAQNLLLAADL